MDLFMLFKYSLSPCEELVGVGDGQGKGGRLSPFWMHTPLSPERKWT